MKQTVFGRIITFMLIVMMITGMLPANVTAQPSVSEQLSEDEQSNASEKVDSGTTYLIKWVEDNNSTATIIYENIMDEVIKDLEKAFFMSPDSSIFAPAFILTAPPMLPGIPDIPSKPVKLFSQALHATCARVRPAPAVI